MCVGPHVMCVRVCHCRIAEGTAPSVLPFLLFAVCERCFFLWISSLFRYLPCRGLLAADMPR